MKKFGDFICKHKVTILIISILLLIPAAIGYFNTKTNYDILVYLPEDIETIAEKIALGCGCEVVTIIGSKILVYKFSNKEKIKHVL